MQNVVITGGSRGIGAAAVRLFSGRGDRVWFLYEKNHAAAEAVARETGAQAICCDVSDEEAVQAAFRRIPGVDILVCNAGICHYGLISQITPAEWRRLFAVNVDGVYHCVRAALPSMLQKAVRQHRDRLVHVGTGRRVVRGGLFRDQGRGPRADQGAGAGAWPERHPRQCRRAGRHSDRYVRLRRAGGAGAAPAGDAHRAARPSGGRGEAIADLADSGFITGQVLGVSGGFVIT